MAPVSTDPRPPLPADLPLGATVDADGTSFVVWSDAAEAVDLCLTDGPDERRVPMRRGDHGRWHAWVPGVGAGQAYGFRVHGAWDPWSGQRANPAKLLVDPYARAVSGSVQLVPQVFGHVTTAAGGGVPAGDDTVRDDRDSSPYVPRSVVVDPAYDWGDDAPPRVPWSETVVYEAQVRTLTAAHPEVPVEQRGTYAGLGHPAVVEHLRSLGVTTVELLPVAHSASEPFLLASGRQNVWGYNTLAFGAPHGAYASSGDTGGQVRELKDAVRALHAAGLEVVLDVVYNHTCEGDETGPTLSLRGLDNAGYYWLRQGGRRYVDHSGCGNALDVRRPAVLSLVTDTLRRWVEEYHVDGFRFDLAPAVARGTEGFSVEGGFLAAVGQDPVLSRVKLVAEPWDLAPGGYRLGGFPPPWSEWNDRFRDAARTFWLADATGAHGHGVRELASRLAGSSDVFQSPGRAPTASVNFVTAHDGFTLHDLVSYERKRNDANGEGNRDGSDNNLGWGCGADGPTSDPDVLALRRRMMRNLLATLLLSTGVPMLTAGDEVGRTQRGNNNAYNLDDATTWLDWSFRDDAVSSDGRADGSDGRVGSGDAPADRSEPAEGSPGSAGSSGHGATSSAGWRADLLAWTRALLALRRDHPVLRQAAFFDGRPRHEGGVADLGWFGPYGVEMDHGAWFDPGLRTLGMFLTGDWQEGDESFLVVLHGGPAPARFVLPGDPWARSYRVRLDTSWDRPEPPPAAPESPTDPSAVRLGDTSTRGEALRLGDPEASGSHTDPSPLRLGATSIRVAAVPLGDPAPGDLAAGSTLDLAPYSLAVLTALR